jgi:hypothetical protein
LGIELHEDEARQWLAAMSELNPDEEMSFDERTGVFGHKVAMLDFSSEELARFRQIGRLVEFSDQPGRVETALALSGSAAQSKIQTHPGDADYFERVNILAPTRDEACRILGEIMRAKALDTLRGQWFQLIEVKFGNFPFDARLGEKSIQRGTPITWLPGDILNGEIEVTHPDGRPDAVTWQSASQDPGWCKLDWVVIDPQRGVLTNASNMLDVTWEAPDGSITPLDGYLDAYFQEIYLESESAPIFAKLAQHVSADAIDNYVEQLEKEVKKYVGGEPPNYGKAAKRMYNVFRLTGRYSSAAFLREMFDEPAAMLYQVWSLIRTIDDAINPDSPVTVEQAIQHCDHLLLIAVEALEGAQEIEITRRMLRLRDALTRQAANEDLSAEAEAARAEVIQIVNNFFYEKMTGEDDIRQYMESISG